jgi:spermidine synthase
VFAAICLLPPTIMMGATLPAVARWVETTPRGVSWLGFFYGGNTIGAVFGCLIAGFYLLRVHNMPIATFAAVALGVTVAAAAFLLARIEPRATLVSAEAPAAAVKAAEARRGWSTWRSDCRAPRPWAPRSCGRDSSACC